MKKVISYIDFGMAAKMYILFTISGYSTHIYIGPEGDAKLLIAFNKKG